MLIKDSLVTVLDLGPISYIQNNGLQSIYFTVAKNKDVSPGWIKSSGIRLAPGANFNFTNIFATHKSLLLVSQEGDADLRYF